MPEARFVVALDTQETALIHTAAADGHGKMLRMAAMFSDAATTEAAPGLERMAQTYRDEAAAWRRIGLHVEAVNPALEPADWEADAPKLADFVASLRAMGFRLEEL